MKIVKPAFSIGIALAAIACHSSRYSTDLPQSDIVNHVEFLASDELAGRYPGSEGDLVSARYIEEYFKLVGLEVGRQEFTFTAALKSGSQNKMSLNGWSIPIDQFGPFDFSADTSANGPVVFCGYGITVKTDSFEWNDYKDADVKGKWVMAFRGNPLLENAQDIFALVSEDSYKALTAMDNGAAGVFLVSGESFDPEDNLVDVRRKTSTAGIPVIHIKRSVAEQILKMSDAGLNISALENATQPGTPLEINCIAEAKADIDEIKAATYNIYGILPGADPLYNKEYLVVGAHYDHLGTGGKGSSSRKQYEEGIHNGADDNASGVAMMMELAAKLTEKGKALKRSYIFVAFGAEEKGLLGSKYFVNNSPVNLESIKAMVNLDMVGRLDTAKGLQIGGTGTSLEADSLIRISNKENLKLKQSREGSGPSDHSSFYGKNIPVFFLTSGAHPDYHTPDDDADRVNYKGMELISRFANQLLLSMDNSKFTFAEAGPKETASGPGYRFKVTLGFMPDFSATDIEGVRVDFVSKGKAAERGGIKNGDIIKAIDGFPVKNIYDYMYRLGKLSKNQIISVEVLRGDVKEVLLIQL